jgi:hypothetical protein
MDGEVFISEDCTETFCNCLYQLCLGMRPGPASLERLPNLSILIIPLLPGLSRAPQEEATKAELSLHQEHFLSSPLASLQLVPFQAKS